MIIIFNQVEFISQVMMDLKTFVYQATLHTLELKTEKGTDYVLTWKSKGVLILNLSELYTSFFNSIKLSEYRTETIICKDPLAAEENSYLSKTVNV